MKKFSSCAATVVFVALLASTSRSQGFPAHPRLLFSADQVGVVQARATTPGTKANWAYARLASSTSVGNPGSYPLGNWSYMRNIRRMQEVALRYVITGYGGYLNNAKQALLGAVNNIPAYGGEAYHAGTYPCAIGFTFDLLYDHLSAAERSLVVTKLEQWVTTFRTSSTVVSSYAGYAGATDNYSFGLFTGVAVALMAIEGDSNYPNLMGELENALSKLQSGWKDAVSPDGSIDESYGYANYGTLYSTYAAIAAENCGLGDRLAGTNLVRAPSWFGASLMANEFPWHGDSSPDHKGLRIDPIIYHLIGRRYLRGLSTQDGNEIQGSKEDFWAMEQIYGIKPISDESATFGLSPYVATLLFAPCAPLLDAPNGVQSLVASRPVMRSRFFRDNKNEGSPTLNKRTNFYELGLGGQAFLHNARNSGEREFSAFHLIRDEWMNHSHEDDGHLGLVLDGVKFFKDVGHGAGPQSTDHNIVLVQGAPGFHGANNNYYAPPSPNGRFLGSREASLFSEDLDYIRGEHSNMWMMAEASRSLVMVKDATNPYLILIDRVNKGDGASHGYEQVFHSAASAVGSGTSQDPMRITSLGKTLRSVYLSPSSVNVLGAGQSSYGNWRWHRNRVVASGTALSFVSVIGPDAPIATSALVAPAPGTSGGVASFSGYEDKILSSTSQASDSETVSDARFVLVRSQGASVLGWSLAEGRQLVHLGSSYLSADRNLVISVRGPSVVASTDGESGIFHGSFFAPFPVATVVVDGQEQPFLQSGGVVFVGSAVPNMSLSSDDRAYTFTDGDVFDGVGSANLLVGSGVMMSSTGWASLFLRGAGLYQPRPISLGMDVFFLPGATGSLAAFRFESSSWSNDLLSAVVRPSSTPGAFNCDIRDGQQNTVGSFSLPLSLNSASGRLCLDFDPQSGIINLRDPLGVLLGTAQVPPLQSPFLIRATVRDASAIDNVTAFDSAEDGVTAQGLAFWVTSQGRAGLATHHPSLLSYDTVNLLVSGQLLDQQLTLLWFNLGQLEEQTASSCLLPGSPLPATVQEVLFESIAIATVPSISLGILCEAPSGAQLGSISNQY